ncbi:MAG: homoserine kinase [Tissierellia bacterium]|nr:homoserine kinase [Tissierellia bacterium]
MKKIKIKVPASSGNIGVGFDVLGMALNLYNEFQFEESDKFSITSNYPQFNNEEHLAYQSFKKVLQDYGEEIPTVKITIQCDIPPSRGLASSGTCIIAGVIAALYFSGREYTPEKVIPLASQLEGHPDNIVSQILGGITASYDDEELFYTKYQIKDQLKALAIVPNYTLSTKDSRAVLPKEIAMKDCVSNMAQSIFLLNAFQKGDFHQLRYFLKDHLHQNFRAKHVKYFNEIIEIALEHHAYGAYLSGAGPTIMIFLPLDNEEVKKELESFLSKKEEQFQLIPLSIDDDGVQIEVGV